MLAKALVLALALLLAQVLLLLVQVSAPRRKSWLPGAGLGSLAQVPLIVARVRFCAGDLLRRTTICAMQWRRSCHYFRTSAKERVACAEGRFFFVFAPFRKDGLFVFAPLRAVGSDEGGIADMLLGSLSQAGWRRSGVLGAGPTDYGAGPFLCR